MEHFEEPIVAGCALLFGLLVLAVFVWSLIWVFSDAEKRGKSGCLVTLMVALLSWPVSLLVWAVFRPDEKQPQPPT